MLSARSLEGYLEIDHRESPGFTPDEAVQAGLRRIASDVGKGAVAKVPVPCDSQSWPHAGALLLPEVHGLSLRPLRSDHATHRRLQDVGAARGRVHGLGGEGRDGKSRGINGNKWLMSPR